MSETETTIPEVWHLNGVAYELHHIPSSVIEAELLASLTNDEADMYEPWYADFPGQLPPETYELRPVNDGEAIRHTVLPLEPCSPYDAISDRLIREGWDPPPLPPEMLETCEHGLAKWLCAGPMHYPDEHEGERF